MHFLVAFAPKIHVQLEFSLVSKIDLASASRAVCAVGPNDDVSAIRVRQNKEVGPLARPRGPPLAPLSLTTQEDSEDYVPTVLSSGSSVRISVCPPTNRVAFAGRPVYEVRARSRGEGPPRPPSLVPYLPPSLIVSLRLTRALEVNQWTLSAPTTTMMMTIRSTCLLIEKRG